MSLDSASTSSGTASATADQSSSAGKTSRVSVGSANRRRRRRFCRPCFVDRRPRGERLGRDRLRGVALRELRSRHASRELHRVAPEDEDTARAEEAEFGARLVVFSGGYGARSADQRLERPDGAVLRKGEPVVFRVCRGDSDEEPSLRPGKPAGEERGPEARQALEARVDGRETLDFARRAAEPLTRPVAETGEAELVVPAPAKKRSGQRPEKQTAAAFLRAG